jgi:threonine dehydrogenase-like Zn-dependent dehydrogenase
MTGGWAIRWWLMTGLAWIAAGCGGQAAAPPARPVAVTDPCAERLHDLSGLLLGHYVTHHRLPERLEELGGGVELSCPVSRKAYIYDPAGLAAPGQEGVLVVYDAMGAHGSFRWAIRLAEPEGGGALVAKVVAVPEGKLVGKR